MEWRVCALLIDGDLRNISLKLFQNQSSCSGGEVILRFAYFKLWRPSSSVEQNDFEQFCYPWNIPVKLFPNLSSLLEEEVIYLNVFLF